MKKKEKNDKINAIKGFLQERRNLIEIGLVAVIIILGIVVANVVTNKNDINIKCTRLRQDYQRIQKELNDKNNAIEEKDLQIKELKQEEKQTEINNNIENLENKANELIKQEEELRSKVEELEKEKQNLDAEITKLKEEKEQKTSSTTSSSEVPSSKQKSTSSSRTTNSSVVYITNTGKKYHKSGCSYLSKSKIEISLSDAKARGYTPCSKCNP